MKRIYLAIAAAVAIASTTSAADIGYRGYPVLRFSWTGCYLGGFGGVGWTNRVNVIDDGNYAHSFFPGGSFDTWSYSLSSSFIGGGTAGCNWQPIGAPWLFGIEGEAGYLHLTSSAFDPLFPAVLGPKALVDSARIGYGYGMVTGRLGYGVDRVLLYVKGGAAFVDESVTVTHPAFPTFALPAFVATASNNNAHWTVGAGIELAFAGNWTVKGEYMFIGTDDLSACGAATANSVPGVAGTYCWTHSGLNGISTAKIGLNYLFGGGLIAF